MDIKKLVSTTFLILAMHIPLNAMTERQAQLGTALVAVGASFVFKDTELVTMASLALGVAAASHCCFRRFTPSCKLYDAKKLLNAEGKNELTDSFIETYESMRSQENLTEHLERFITRLYPSIPDKNPYPFVTAMLSLDAYSPNVLKAQKLIQSVPNLINSKQEPNLWKEYDDLQNKAATIWSNIGEARSIISNMEQYKQQLELYRQFKQKSEELALQRKNLELEEKRVRLEKQAADIEAQKAKAASTQASAINNIFRLELAKWLFTKQKVVCCSILLLCGYILSQ